MRAISLPIRRLDRGFLALPILALLFLVLADAGKAFAKPLSVRDVIAQSRIKARAGLHLSPDGHWLAYTASKPNAAIPLQFKLQQFTESGLPLSGGPELFALWITNVDTGEIIKCDPGTGNSWGGAWSADSRQFAYYSDSGGKLQIYVWNAITHTSSRVSDTLVHPFFLWELPKWDAAGNHLLVKVAPEDFAVTDLAQMGLAPVTGGSENGMEASSSSPAPKVHVYRSAPSDSKTAEESVANDTMLPVLLSDLALIDVHTGTAKRIAKNAHPAWYAFSPDGQNVALMERLKAKPGSWVPLYDLVVLSLRYNSRKVLAHSIAGDYGRYVSWSPDSSRIAYTDLGAQPERGCFVVDIATAKAIKVSEGVPSDLQLFPVRAPLWSRDGRALIVISKGGRALWKLPASGGNPERVAIPAGQSLADVMPSSNGNSVWSSDAGRSAFLELSNEATKADGLYSLNLASNALISIGESGWHYRLSTGGGSEGINKLAYLAENAQHAEEVWILDLESRSRKQLSRLNPQFEGVEFGQVTTVRWLSSQGEPLEGALILPTGYQKDKRYPLVVWIYPGDNGGDKINDFALGWDRAFLNPQILANHGYAVLDPDIPIRDEEPIQSVEAAVLPAVNKMIELGIADPDKLVAMGQSYGGYGTLGLITGTTRFQAAVITSALGPNLFEGYTSFSQTFDWAGYYETGQGRMHCTPWECRDKYIRNSPILFIDKVRTPLFIERGTEDIISASDGEIFSALRRLGRTVEFVEYEAEGHTLESPENIIDCWQRRFAFLDKHLNERASQESK